MHGGAASVKNQSSPLSPSKESLGPVIWHVDIGIGARKSDQGKCLLLVCLKLGSFISVVPMPIAFDRFPPVPGSRLHPPWLLARLCVGWLGRWSLRADLHGVCYLFFFFFFKDRISVWFGADSENPRLIPNNPLASIDLLFASGPGPTLSSPPASLLASRSAVP
jgi:hypothetical protein